MKLSHIFWRQSKLIAVLGFVIFSVCYYSISYASTNISSDIEADTTWDMAGSPYLVSHSIAIIPDVTLTIDPGVIVKFDYNASLNVIGKLAARGTEVQPIYFTSLYDDTLGGGTDDEEELCTEQVDSDGNPTGVEVCEVLDLNDPLPGDWDGLFFNSPLASSLENVSLSYAADSLTFYATNATLKNLNIKESEAGISVYANSHLEFFGGDIRNLNGEAIVLFNHSSINLKDVNISNIGNEPISIFNESTFTAENLHIYDLPVFDSPSTDVIALFNSSALSLKNSSLEYCPREACITFFNTQNYISNPIHLTVENTAFNGGSGSAFLTFGGGESVTDINNSSIKNFSNYGVENYASVAVQAKNNDWGDLSGPMHATLNPSGMGQKLYGLVDFDPWIGKAGPIPEIYYARITDAPGGIGQMYESASKDSVLIKTFPNDWILKVFSKTLTSDGWVKVQDLTDGSEGWMQGGLARLPYEKGKQKEYENDSSVEISGRDNRATKIVEVIRHYYNNTDTKKSLYSADDIGQSKISKLKQKNFPVELVLAIVSQESETIDYDNEHVSHDYGHGIMQITFNGFKHEEYSVVDKEHPVAIYQPEKYKENYYDNRGEFSLIYNYLCRNWDKKSTLPKKQQGLKEYYDCYKNAGKGKKVVKPYKHYKDDDNNPIYKQYTNTPQSIYANIKDGLGNFLTRIKTKCPKKSKTYSSKKYGTEEFACEDIEKILTVWGYNGFGKDKNGTYTGHYIKDIATRLDNLSKYFKDIEYVKDERFIKKMKIADDNKQEIFKFSPIELQILDSTGNKLGEFDSDTFEGIENSYYDSETEGVVILFPEEDFTYRAVGEEEGNYGLAINFTVDGEDFAFSATNLPITKDEIHTYNVDQEKLQENQPNAVIVSIDKNGDGAPERTIYAGNELTNLEPLQELTPARIVPAGVVPLWAIPQNIIPQVLGAQTKALNTKTTKKVGQIPKKKPKPVAIKKKLKNSTVPKKEVVTEPKIQQENIILPSKVEQKRPSLFIRLWHLLF